MLSLAWIFFLINSVLPLPFHFLYIYGVVDFILVFLLVLRFMMVVGWNKRYGIPRTNWVELLVLVGNVPLGKD